VQISIYEEDNIRQEGIIYAVGRILKGDPYRYQAKEALVNKDSDEVFKYFQETIRTYGFSGPDMWSMTLGKLISPIRSLLGN